MASNSPAPPPATRTRPRKASTATPVPGGLQPTPAPEAGVASTSSAVGGPAVSMAPPSLSGSGGPQSKEDCEHIVAQLLDTSHPNKRRLELACELRDTAESNRDFALYGVYLSTFIPALVTILGDEKTIAFGRETFDHRYRHTLLSFLHRLPHNEPFKVWENTVMELMIKLMKSENEENALVCIKIMIDGFRAHKEQAEPHVEPFLELVKTMYANTKTVVEKEFGEKSGLKPPASAGLAPSPNPPTPASDSSAPPPPPAAPQQSPNSPYARALHSPKVLTECPIAVVLIFQTWKNIMPAAMLDFYPLVMESIRIQPEPQRKAHEDAKAKDEVFVGVASGIHNREMYTELIKAQVKTMAFLAYVLRGSGNNDIKHYLELFPEACVRLLKDCPPEDVATRKELLVATRHILTSDSRSSFVPYIDVLLDEKVLVGTGITCKESLRPLAYSVVADLIHHVRNELDLKQLTKVVQVFSFNLNDPTFSSAIQTMCAKLLNTIIESISSKEDKAETAKLISGIYVTCMEKMAAFIETYDRIKALRSQDIKGKGKAKEAEADEDVEMKEDKESDESMAIIRQANGWRDIEQAMQVQSVAYAHDTLEAFCREGRYLFKTLLHLLRTLLAQAKADDNEVRAPDGESLGRTFEHCLRSLTVFEGIRDPREPKEAIELFSQILLALNPHEFNEIWTNRMDFFVELAAPNMHVFSVVQVLITHQDVSHQLVAILLKYLMDHLGDVGSQDAQRSHLTLRLFKMSFLAINSYIDKNEGVLVPHLQKLIMGSFTYAAKAADPMTYYYILRALFRSIGGGRFEALYKEVLPILQEMLDTLAYLLKYASEESQKDLFTELTLTVPVRLTNLLPHLSYLMAPLVHALQGGHELVSQGLRTLELCIDNLTADFLDPNLNPVLKDLMAGLHRLLRPVPSNRAHAHSAVKILGKLGGRNRRFVEVDYTLHFRTSLNELTAPISFEGKTRRLQLEPLVDAAVSVLREDKAAYLDDAVDVLRSVALAMLSEDAPPPEGNLVLQKAMMGLFRACGREDQIAERALSFVQSFARRIYAGELAREDSQVTDVSKFSPVTVRKGHAFLPLTSTIPDSFVYALERATPADCKALAKLLTTIVADLIKLAASDVFATRSEPTARTVERLISGFAHRFIHMCHAEEWSRKMAGTTALRGLLVDGDVPRKWVLDLEIEVVRALLYCLRDSPKEYPPSVDEVVSMVKHFIQTCQSREDGRNQRQQRLIDTLVTELSSPNKLARDSAHDFIALLAEVNEKSISELVGPTAKAKLLDGPSSPVFNKPLRALPFNLQIGVIDAVTWLIELRPTVVEYTDEFIRLFHEVVALADVDDQSLAAKPGQLKNEQWLKTLRISCIRLLRSSMATADFQDKPNLSGLRPRVIQVYFKHVYSTDTAIVQVSFDGLRDVIQQQSKLPKEVLQTGLRPILVNLADAKRLSVPGLDGLAKFLELLNNYFKVEIGIKLLDHFQSLSDEQTLNRAAQGPLEDNPDITRMSRLVNIFRLLPPSAVQFLVRLVGLVVDAEARLHQTAPGPFTEVLGKYLDRYHEEACTTLFENIRNSRYVWTYRNIIASGHAPQLIETMSNRCEDIVNACFAEPDNVELVMPGLYLIRELTRADPGWLNARQEVVLTPVVNVWRAILGRSRETKESMSEAHYSEMPALVVELFMGFLRQQRHIPLLSHVVEAFEIRSPFERSAVAFFLYQQVALQASVEYRRELIEYFLTLYDQDEVSWSFKTNMLRLIINPTLRLYFDDPDNDGTLVTSAFIQKVNETMWKPLAVPAAAKEREDALLIEVFSLTTLLIKHVHTKVDQSRKEVFKFAWMGINLLEPTVKLTAYVLTATFMATYETPAKFIKLCWIGLLRLKESETRIIYREALRILATTLPKLDPPGQTTIPEWAQRVRGILIEEGQTPNQLVTVCELLVNHPDLFYEYRELYVPHIANSLSKLAFLQNNTPELKKLSVDAVELIFRWERRRIASVEAERMDVDGGSGRKRTSDTNEHGVVKKQRIDGTGTALSASSGGGWGVPGQVRELMTAHLLRLVSQSSDPVGKGGLTKRALDLFKEILGPKGLPNVHVKLGFFQRPLAQEIKDETFNIVANSAEVIAAIAASKDQKWVRSNLSTLSKLLEKVWTSEEAILHEIVEPLTTSLFKELPEDDAMEIESDGRHLLKFVKDSVTEGLQAGLRASSALPGTLFLIRHWLKAQPQQLQTEMISTGLLKVFANLVKVHTSNPGNPNTNQTDPAHRFIISILDILRDRVGDLREHRRHFQSTLSGLIERTTNVSLCRYLLDLLRQWVLEDPEPTSQAKEKSSLLRTMSVFEQRGDDDLFEKYLDFIFEIYEMPALRGTDMTYRLEPCFLLGAKSKSPSQRARFLDKLEQSLPFSLDGRLQYLYSLQNWDCIADSYWIPQILSMLLALAGERDPLIRQPLAEVMGDDSNIVELAREATIADLIGPARNLIHEDQDLAHRLWVAVFPHIWSALTRAQQASFTPYVVKLLGKEYHRKQIDSQPNVIQTFMDGLIPCSPPVALPPLMVKWLAKSFNAFYTGFELLDRLAEPFGVDDVLRDHCYTALAELYSELCEDDMYYGLSRNRCSFPETTAAVAYEQNGMWPKAIEMYEQAQVKARNGLLPFSEPEYCFWEEHWVLSAQKLQHWDGLTELARQDNDSDLLLEAAWRLSDWGSTDRESIETNLNRIVDAPTPRRKTFEAFLVLLRSHTAREPPDDFVRVVDEAQQISLKKWSGLPSRHLTGAHLPLLQMFQQTVELGEASQVFDSLQMTNQGNLEQKANSELKHIFSTWRERLPNFWDDIGVWSDLLAWRQHVFTAVTKVYVPLIPAGENSTFGYRGYHEQAWMINRFGEVARKHGLLDVCSIALNKIYSLPNIEISEAFLKLREQALCFFQKPEKFNEGLDNISTTNLMYFTSSQKAEFLTLKGMFISRLGQMEEANSEFAHAIQMDINLPKAWAEWGRFNDKLYRERSETVPPVPDPEPGQPQYSEEHWAAKYTRDRAVLASSAVSCYLQAAGLYNNHKSRGLLLRVLWLLGLDDNQSTIAKGFDNYKGDLVVWYWITLIPQLLLSLSHREAKQARTVLMRLAKMYPQALFYNMRVLREEWGGSKRTMMHNRAAAAKKAQDAQAQAARAAAAGGQASGEATNPAAAQPASSAAGADGDIEMKEVKDENAGTAAKPGSQNGSVPPPSAASVPTATPRAPNEMLEEINNMLKTAFPLLALMMERMVDHISIRAKPNSEEDIYRFFAALLNDAMQQWCGRNVVPNDEGELGHVTKENLTKFAHNLSGELRSAIQKDFMEDMPKLKEYIIRLQYWRDVYERSLDDRGKTQSLDMNGCNLNEFHLTKFDEVDVPGQYLQHIDPTDELVKISRFAPSVELGRGHGHCFRRITIVGSNGAPYTFVVQMPAARHCRREDRLIAFFRIMNSVLAKRKESRRRNLQFHLPTAVAFAHQLRLVQSDSTYVSLQDILDEHCRSMGMSREDSTIKFYERIKSLHDPSIPASDARFLTLKIEVMEEIQTKYIPDNILTNYMIKTMKDSESLWLMRKQFAIQSAANMFLTYMCCLHGRAPSRFQLSRKTGGIYMTEILPATSSSSPIITSTEAVPFRLTPNMQHFITKTGIEGVVTAVLTAISRSLVVPEFDLSGTLTIFLRDEVVFWQSAYKQDPRNEIPNATLVYTNADKFIRRAETIGYLGENKDKSPNAPPALHTTVTLINAATSPNFLAQMPESYQAWF